MRRKAGNEWGVLAQPPLDVRATQIQGVASAAGGAWCWRVPAAWDFAITFGLTPFQRRLPLPAMQFDWHGKEFWNLVAIAWAGVLAAGALVLEHGFGQLPCALCLNQRAWIMLAGLFAAAGFAHNPRLGIYPLLAVAASLAGGAFSIRHLYLLTLPADQVPGCGVDFDYMIDVFPALDVLRHMAQGTGECTEQGVLIPAAALVGFVGMVALTITYWRQR